MTLCSSNEKEIDCIITTGGTGLTGRDTTPEAVMEIANKTIEGFGGAEWLVVVVDHAH